MSRKTSSSPPPAPRTQLGLSASLRRLGISTNLRKAERQGRHDHKVNIDLVVAVPLALGLAQIGRDAEAAEGRAQTELGAQSKWWRG